MHQIFIDYGENWENAWNAHVENWEKMPLTDSNVYTPLAEMIANDDLRTVDELKTNPYPENIQLLCYVGMLIDFVEGEEGNREYLETMDGSSFKVEKDFLHDDPEKLLPCHIHEKDSNSNEYKVQFDLDERSVVIENYPKTSIVLMTKRYSSDQHIQGAFRHFMEIDEDIFPSYWKNK